MATDFKKYLDRRKEFCRKRLERLRLEDDPHRQRLVMEWGKWTEDPSFRQAVEWAERVVSVARTQTEAKSRQRVVSTIDVMRPLLRQIMAELPGRLDQMNKDQKAVALQIMAIECASKEDVVQRGLECLFKLWGLLTRDDKQKGGLVDDRDLAKTLEKVGKETFQRLQKNAKSS